jgi:diguanylate cyclase (GGDEF)-like protein/PAS domain S-box-containing protein
MLPDTGGGRMTSRALTPPTPAPRAAPPCGPPAPSRDRTSRILAGVPTVSGALVAALAVVVLAGWTSDVQLLKSVAPELPSMKALTAVGLGAAAGAVLLLRSGAGPRAVWVGRGLAGAMALIGLVVLGEYLLGDLGIDEVPFEDSGTYPGRPSPHTALAFVLLGAAIATLDGRRPAVRRLHLGLTVGAAIVVLFAFAGYVYGVDYLRGVTAVTGMAIHTLAALTLLSAGLVCLRPDQGLSGWLLRPGAEAAQGRWLLATAVVAPLATGIAVWEGQEAGIYGARVAGATTTLTMIVVLVVVAVVTQQRLRSATSEVRRLATVVEHSDDAILCKTLDGTITSWNHGAERIYGYSAAEIVGQSIDLLVPPDRTDELRQLLEAVRRREPIVALESRRRRKDGQIIAVSLTISPILDDRGEVVGGAAIARDVTERLAAQRALAESEERFRRAYQDSAVGMALLAVGPGDLGRLTDVNLALCEITGHREDRLRGMRMQVLAHDVDRDSLEADLAALVAGDLGVLSREVRLMRPEGDPAWTWLTASVVRDASGAPLHAVLQAQDITERKRFEGQLQHLADHDAMTGLLNRRRFEEELRRVVSEAHRYGDEGAVLVLDLDHFKLVNDTLGHAAGDELVRTVAGSLRARLRTSDVLGRLGGDEFAVLLPRADLAQARRLAEELLTILRDDPQVAGAGAGTRVTASIGLAPFGGPGPERDAEELLAEADIAMYDAKEAGRNRHAVFDVGEQRHERMRSRVTWAARIEAALDEDRFVLHAQPIVPLAPQATEVRRFELLVRMLGPDGDVIPPGTFLYVAEQSDLAQRIDRWVIDRATALVADQEARGLPVDVAVNLSARSIGDPAVPGRIEEALRTSGADPRRLTFEVTETSAIVNVVQAKAFADRLRELGSAFALDDFGAGFASFYYLKHLSFDFVKIDGEFVQHLTSSRTNVLIVEAVVALARGLGKQTIAEFVGSEETVALLRRLGVDHAQGFHVGMPRPLDEIDFAAVPSLDAPPPVGVRPRGA